MKPQEEYLKIIKKREILKRVTQISWNVTQFERRFPLEQASDEDFDTLNTAYQDFINDLLLVAQEVNKIKAYA